MNVFRREKNPNQQQLARVSNMPMKTRAMRNETEKWQNQYEMMNTEKRRADETAKEFQTSLPIATFSRASSSRSDDEGHEPLTRSPKQDVQRKHAKITMTRAEAPQHDSFLFLQARMTAGVTCAFYVVDLLVLCILRAIWLAENGHHEDSSSHPRTTKRKRSNSKKDCHLHSTKQVGAHHHRLAVLSAEF